MLVVLGLGALLALMLLEPSPKATIAAAEADVERAAPPAARQLDQTAALTAPAARPQRADAHDRDYDPAVHPHPLTSERARIHLENDLIQGLNDAMDSQDPAGMRQVLAAYRRSHPEDPHRLQDGYALIADCLDEPGPASRAAGERYMKEHRASILRRFVERHCVKTAPRSAQSYRAF